MFLIPFPLLIAEVFIFMMAIKHWGFLNTLAAYLLPSLLGLVIISTVGRMAIMTLQSSVMRGQLPANKILHSGAVFLSGLFFLIPSFFTRLIAVILLLPGLRHLVIWRFKLLMAKKVAQGSAKAFGGFSFGKAGSNASGGFRYYEFRNEGTGIQDDIQPSQEREVKDAEVLDVRPLEISHEVKKTDKE